jgi:6-phosphofructokinase 1
MEKHNRIAVLTSGGDCSGLNAAIRSVVHAGHQRGWEVIGIEEGTEGLLDEPKRIRKLHPSEFDTTLLRRGGTVLGSISKGGAFRRRLPDGSIRHVGDEVVEALKNMEIDALIGIGGDGSMKILSNFTGRAGINLIGIPKTIDNDLMKTEASIGFHTAVEVATEALDRLQPTAASHDRVMVMEVMGRDAGHIALWSGIAGGADVILIPEIGYDINKVTNHIQQIREDGRNFALVVVAEAVTTVQGEKMQVKHAGGSKRYGGVGHYIGQKITHATGAETRVTILGHIQRGGQPIPMDRVMASAFGVHAVNLVADGATNRMVAWQNRGVTDVHIDEVTQGFQAVDLDGSLVKTAREMGICLGD